MQSKLNSPVKSRKTSSHFRQPGPDPLIAPIPPGSTGLSRETPTANKNVSWEREDNNVRQIERGIERETKRGTATERKTNHAGKLVYNNCYLQGNILTKYQQIEQQNTNKILTNRQQEKAPCSQHKYYISQIHKAIYIKVQQIFSRAPPGIVSFFLALTDIRCLWGIWKTDNNKEQRAQSRGRRSGRRSGNILYFK